jgi:hypothetical protein
VLGESEAPTNNKHELHQPLSWKQAQIILIPVQIMKNITVYIYAPYNMRMWAW